ncbi:MAG: SMI1/KNR4 family protein [Candidatus Goldbacteria bacterium]|nr:SMI1/KNR4 family protein [Candidatus Goldiibacteriota bacterium]
MIDKKIKKKILLKRIIEEIDDKDIDIIEKKLNVKLHPDYRWIIKNLGMIWESDEKNEEVILELLGAPIDEDVMNIINVNKYWQKKQKLPENWMIISINNKYHNILVLDNNTGEIYEFNFDSFKNERKLFNSLNDLLKDIYFCSKQK